MRRTFAVAIEVVRSLLALTAMVGVVIGVPWALVSHVGWPLPTTVPTIGQIGDALTGASISDAVLVKLAAFACWAAWVLLVASLVAEASAWASGRSAIRVPLAGAFQPLARQLVLSALVVVGSLRSTAPPPVVLAAHPTVHIDEQGGVDLVQMHRAEVVSVPAEDGSPTAGYIVKPRDSLWKLAEVHLGDGFRWREIFECNRDRLQPDGRSLQVPDHIHPGWVLLLPADATGLDAETPLAPTPSLPEGGSDASVLSPAEQPPPADHTQTTPPSTEGAEALPELTPDGHGPSDAAAPPPPSVADGDVAEMPPPVGSSPDPSSPPASSEEISGAAGPPPGQSATGPTNGTDSLRRAAPDAQDERVDTDTGVSVPAAVVGGGLLAAGVVATLVRLRSVQQRRRRQGHLIPMPAESSGDIERDLRSYAASAPGDRLDLALRAFAAAVARAGDGGPRIAAVGVETVAGEHPGEVEILLVDPLTAPAGPFEVQAAGRSWTLPVSVLLSELTRLAVGQAAPAPALVPVGSTTGREILIDLEALPRTSIRGESDDVQALLWSMLVGLATSTWADDLHLIVVGTVPDGLAGLERVEAVASLDEVLDRLEAEAAAVTSALAATRSPATLAARAAGKGDGWIPTVVALLRAEDDDALERLLTLAGGRCAVAVVGPDLPEDLCDRRLVVGDGAVDLHPPGLTLATMSPAAEVRTAVEDILATAQRADDGDPSVDVPTGGAPGEVTMLELFDLVDAVASAEVTVGVIGSVRVEGGASTIDRRKSVELVVYLALHPDGVDEGRIKAALWPDQVPSTGTFNQTVSKARSCLGISAAGSPHLPHVVQGIYRLGPSVAVDHHVLESRLIAAKAAPSKSTMAVLAESLASARGLPLEGSKGGYEWAYAEGFVSRIQAVASDAAHHLAEWHLDHGDATGALRAAEQGLLASPGDEVLFRDRMRAHDLAGNPAGVETVMEELCHVVEANDPYDDLHPETMALYDQLSRRPRRRTG